ncbi:alpha/beta fold hydrolase [Georgenia alba]|uniref:Alpha/beta fold hydrolase n=1 Tax=Georgenia alba TaxID=2233858 RepID=A0ABW2Q9B8_9MICO
MVAVDGTGAASFPPIGGVTHRFVDAGGLRTHVAEAGPTGAPPVLLLHGFPQHWWVWRHVVTDLARDHHVVVPDLRGAGWTDAPDSAYDREELLGDLLALLDALHLTYVDVIAHDWSALVTFQLCLRHPGRVSHHMAIGVPHPYLRFDARLLAGMRHTWFQEVIITPVLGPRMLRGGHQRLARHLFTAFAADGHVWSAADLECYLRPLREPARAAAASRLYRMVLGEGLRILRGTYLDLRLSTPTVLLLGAEDPVVRADLLGGYDTHADDLVISTVTQAAHWVVDERPDAVVAHARALFGHP